MSLKKIRLLALPSWYPPDGGYFFKEHSEALLRTGCDVDVLVNRMVGIRKIFRVKRGEWGKFVVRQENGLRVVRSVYCKIPGNEKLNIKRWANDTRRLFGKYQTKFGRPDIILAHSVTWAGLAAAKIKCEYDIPYLITEQRSFFVWSSDAAKSLIRPYYLPSFREAFIKCEKLILVSESMKTGILNILPGAEDKIEVIPNMINGDFFGFSKKSRGFEPFIFITAARLAEVKGLDILISAFSALSRMTERKVLLRILGKGELRKKLEEQARSVGLHDRVIFTGRISRDRMVEEMQKANCFVLASRYEAFGIVLIEAMATGLPVVATRSGGPGYIVDGSSGYLVEPDNVEELAKAMLKMMSGYDQFHQEKIRERTLQKYGSKIISKRYMEIFKEILRKR